MKNLKIYDPAMCSSSGVCGPNVNEKLVELSELLQKIEKDGVIVERYNISQQPNAYVDNAQVAKILKENGTEALPLFFVNDKLVKSGSYPSTEEMINLLELQCVVKSYESEIGTAKGEKMSQENLTEQNEPGRDKKTPDESSCSAGCSCNAKPGNNKWLLGTIIIVITCVLVVRALTQKRNEPVQNANSGFALPQNREAKASGSSSRIEQKAQVAESSSPSKADVPHEGTSLSDIQKNNDVDSNTKTTYGETINSLADLNTKAIDKDGVFVLLINPDTEKAKDVVAVIEKVAADLRKRNINVGIYILKGGAEDYKNLTKQVSVPCVLAMVKGHGASAVSKDITEANVMQAFVAVSSASGCGCGPSGCQ